MQGQGHAGDAHLDGVINLLPTSPTERIDEPGLVAINSMLRLSAIYSKSRETWRPNNTKCLHKGHSQGLNSCRLHESPMCKPLGDRIPIFKVKTQSIRHIVTFTYCLV